MSYLSKTMRFKNEFDMAWYLDEMRRKNPKGFRADSIKKTGDGIYLVIRENPQHRR